jgi:hypothetical protein
MDTNYVKLVTYTVLQEQSIAHIVTTVYSILIITVHGLGTVLQREIIATFFGLSSASRVSNPSLPPLPPSSPPSSLLYVSIRLSLPHP